MSDPTTPTDAADPEFADLVAAIVAMDDADVAYHCHVLTWFVHHRPDAVDLGRDCRAFKAAMAIRRREGRYAADD
jgi:hypothetical protein